MFWKLVIWLLSAFCLQCVAQEDYSAIFRHALYEGDRKTVSAIIKDSPKIDQESFDSLGNTCLNIAAKNGFGSEVILFCLKHGADPNTVNKQGHTPLTYALRAGKGESARKLLDAGANVRTHTPWGWSPVMFAVANNVDAETIKALQLKGDKVSFSNFAETGDFLAKCYKSDLDSIRKRLEEGYDPNCYSQSGWLPLTVAVQNKNIRLIELLLQYNADVNLYDYDHRKVILDAALEKNLDLLEIKSSLSRQTRKLRLPNDTATPNENDAIKATDPCKKSK